MLNRNGKYIIHDRHNGRLTLGAPEVAVGRAGKERHTYWGRSLATQTGRTLGQGNAIDEAHKVAGAINTTRRTDIIRLDE